jgi:EF-hand domain pair
MSQQFYLKEERLLQAFKAFDKDNDGKISADELKNILGGKPSIHINSYHIIWHNITTSYHITSYRITSPHHIISQHITASYGITSPHHITTHHITTSYLIISHHITTHHRIMCLIFTWITMLINDHWMIGNTADQKVNFDKSVFDKLVKEADANGDGFIDFNEFLNLMKSI